LHGHWFFGDSIRFRTNQSIIDELLTLKARAKTEGGVISVFFVDDNFAISIKRTKSLLRDIIAAGAQLPWIAQISANLLRDQELVDLIAESGGKVIFIGWSRSTLLTWLMLRRDLTSPKNMLGC
jgi:hypothetical protein